MSIDPLSTGRSLSGVKLQNSQAFLSLYFSPGEVEYAEGGIDPFNANQEWDRETKLLGQVATPRPVAELMARWTMSMRPESVLDPAAGLGGLLHACVQLGPGSQLVGIERDRKTLQHALRTAPRGAKLIATDYLLSDAGQFGGIIANPPYVKAQRLGYSEDDWRMFEERFGTPLNRLTNLYALFLLKIWEDLAPGGRAAVILPAEFLNANFGVEIKARLLNPIRPAGIAVFSPKLNVFADALTTSSLVFLEKAAVSRRQIRAERIDSLEQAATFVSRLLEPTAAKRGGRAVDLAKCDPGEKWLNRLLTPPARTGGVALPKRVGDFFLCRRGIATGANDFFCLSRPDLQRHGLASSHFEPCVTKAADADGLVFTAEKLRDLDREGRSCHLLSPRRLDDALETYLAWGDSLGIPQRHLPSHRPTWYLPENRGVASVLAAVFSRGAPKFILNTSGAKNLTCFHGLYPRAGWEHSAPLLTLFLNSRWGRTAFSSVNRFYGNGLNKLEPKDVEDLPCPELPRLTEAEALTLRDELHVMETQPAEMRAGRIDALTAARFGFEFNPD